MREELKKHKHKRCHEMKQMKYIVNYRNEMKQININGHLYIAKKNKNKTIFSPGKAVKIDTRARPYNMYGKKLLGRDRNMNSNEYFEDYTRNS